MLKLHKTILTIVLGLILTFSFHILTPKAEAPTDLEREISGVLTISKNALTAVSPLPEPKVKGTLNVIVTAYSSTIFETDEDPFITASGNHVRDGIIANNLLPFGTRIRIPEIYGNKIFVVEDRMNSRKSDFHFDIWFADTKEAIIFGVEKTYIEILES